MENKKEWDAIVMVLLCVVSFCIPLVGLVIGLVNRRHYARKEQCSALIWISVVMAVVYAFIPTL